MAKEANNAMCMPCAEEGKKFFVTWNAIGKREMQRHKGLKHPELPKEDKLPVDVQRRKR